MSDLNQVPWAAWTPEDLASKLRQVNRPWYVVGGWALDLWHGTQIRPHEDLEFCILRPDFSTFQTALKDWPLSAATNGQIIALEDAPVSSITQFWGMDTKQTRWVFDMMIEPGTAEHWQYKRDPAFNAPRSAMIRYSNDHIPYLNPAAILLFKAKHQRPKDEADFQYSAPLLTAQDRAWLRNALQQLHPDHAWISQL